MEKKIIKEITIGNKKIILYESIEKVPEEGDQNLVAVDENDELLWKAELPANPYDNYFKFEWDSKTLKAWSSNSHLVEIDPNNGSILSKKMVW